MFLKYYLIIVEAYEVDFSGKLLSMGKFIDKVREALNIICDDKEKVSGAQLEVFDFDQTARENVSMQKKPFISVVIPNKTDEICTQSLLRQSYTEFETVRLGGGISGEYILLLKGDEELSCDALFEFAKAVSRDEQIELVYADECIHRDDGTLVTAFFKPQFSRETLLCSNYIGAYALVSRRVYDKIGGGSINAPDKAYKYILKCAKNARGIYHIEKTLILRHDREELSSVQADDCAQVLNDHLSGCAMSGNVAQGLYWGSFQIMNNDNKKARTGVVVFANVGADGLRRLLESLESNTAGCEYELSIIDCGFDRRTRHYCTLLESAGAARIMRGEKELNTINMAARKCDCDKLLFLNSNAEIISPAFIKNMREAANLTRQCAAGARITNAQGNIANIGYTIGLGGWVDSLYRGCGTKAFDDASRFYIETLRNVSALSMDCMMINTETFYDLNGFDESFEGAGADIDICIRLIWRGGVCVYTPFAQIRRYNTEKTFESLSDKDKTRIYDAIRETLTQGDAFYGTKYDYSSLIPRSTAAFVPPILLNPFKQM